MNFKQLSWLVVRFPIMMNTVKVQVIPLELNPCILMQSQTEHNSNSVPISQYLQLQERVQVAPTESILEASPTSSKFHFPLIKIPKER